MRGRSSKQGNKGGLNIDKVDKIKEPHLSGAYIRSLVKQLTSSTRTKDPLNSKEQETLDAEGGFSSYQNLTKTSDGLISETQQSQPPQQQQPPPPPQHKKQVRRRLRTSRPYQERLLNMAEARREIVTALKFHRASMKQTHDQKQQQQQQEKQQDTDMETSRQTLQQQQPMEQERGKSKSRRNPRIYASNNNNTSNGFTNYVDNFSYPAFTYPPNYSSPYPSWPLPPVPPPPLLLPENPNFPLPNQTLGLNLNLQDFSNLDRNFYHYADNSNSSPSPSSSSSSQVVQVSMQGVPNPTIIPEQERVPIMAIPNEESGMVESESLGLHHAMDDKEMAEIRSIGEQHQMEWNDTINLVTSALWFKFLKTMEIDPQEKKVEEFGNFPFHEEVMEFPSWLNANDDEDGCFLEQQRLSDYYCSDDYMQDPALPW